jgi:hypothetical protein
MLTKRIEALKLSSERKVSVQQKQQLEQSTSVDKVLFNFIFIFESPFIFFNLNSNKIESSLNSASKNREEKLEEIIEKQRRQDERRRRVMRAVNILTD